MNNGVGTIIRPSPALSESQQACVELLEEVLDMAKEGKIHSIGIVGCLDDAIATVMAGKQAGDLNLGLDNLKNKIHAAIFEDGNVKQRKQSILRAR